MSLSRPRPLEFYAPQVTKNRKKDPFGLNDVCRVCNHFKYCEDFERVHALDGRRTARTKIRGDPEFYIITILTNHLLRDGEKLDDAERLRDCPYCRLIFDALNFFFKDGTSNWREDAMESPTLFIQVKVRPGRPLVLTCDPAFIVHYDFTLVRGDLEVFTLDPGSLTAAEFPCAQLAFPEPEDLSRHRGSEGFIRYWFRGCSGYKDATDQCYYTPNRLLYLDYENDEVVLWECLSNPPGVPDVPDPIEYATLSHGWLNTDPGVPKLLMSNIDDWKQGRTISGLPEAIRDAAKVAHLNDVHFLFIDSMCIIQDNLDDLRVQMPMMAHYFRDSILTIVAASSLSPDDGFLHPPKRDWITKQLEFVAPNGAGATLTLRRKYSRRESPSDCTDSSSVIRTVSPGSFRRTGPLYGRHWCLNEALLGTRVIHFTSGGIMCQCRRHGCTREGTMKYNRADWYRGMSERFRVRNASDAWLNAVEFHTSCDKLRGEDRLSKLSGVASMSGMGIEDRYVAGLWWKSMAMGLLWEVNLRPGQTNTTKIALPFSKQRAPSFSWASVDAPVVWRDNFDWTIRSEARVVKFGNIPQDPEDPCGGVDGAWICMEGFMMKCEVSQTLEGAGGDRWQFAYFTGKDGTKTKAHPFAGDGALVVVKGKGAMERLRKRHTSKTQRRLRTKGSSDAKEDNPHRSRAYLTRNHHEFRQNMLGPKTTRGVAWVLCLRQRGDYDEDRLGVVFDRWDGLVLTRSMRYPGAFERIGCIRDVPSTLLDLNDRQYSVKIV
ncbi:hypothetical protein V8C42DRAFT_315515 [Trichoderma barbatum]